MLLRPPVPQLFYIFSLFLYKESAYDLLGLHIRRYRMLVAFESFRIPEFHCRIFASCLHSFCRIHYCFYDYLCIVCINHCFVLMQRILLHSIHHCKVKECLTLTLTLTLILLLNILLYLTFYTPLLHQIYTFQHKFPHSFLLSLLNLLSILLILTLFFFIHFIFYIYTSQFFFSFTFFYFHFFFIFSTFLKGGAKITTQNKYPKIKV